MRSDNQFLNWIENLAEQREVRIAVRDEGEWIERQSIASNIDEDEIELEAAQTEETRYYLRTEDGRNQINKWKRYHFPFHDEDQKGIELVIEIPTSVEDGGLPRPSKDKQPFALPSKVLNFVNEREGYSAVDADRVAGLESEKKRLKRFLETTNSGWGLADEAGIILEGPPGTGKTELVIELCQEMYGSMPVMISGPEILSKWVGESERMLRRKFEEARNSNSEQPVLYIDELDAIARTRSEGSEDHSAQIVAQLLVLLDGVEAKQEADRGNPLKVIASTNLSHVVDPALRRPGRLGNRPIKFDRPSSLERKAILHHYLEHIRRSEEGQLGDELQKFVTDVQGENRDTLNAIIGKSEGFTGADLEDLIQESVSQLQRDQGNQLTLNRMEEVVEEDFEPSDEINSERFDELEGDLVDSVEISPETRIYKRGGNSTPQEVAKSYFHTLSKTESSDGETLFKYREITPEDILEDDPVRAKENVVEAFQHAENERICLYIRDVEEIAQAREHSSIVNGLIGTINEQILQWNRENLIVLDSLPDHYNQITNIGDD